MLNGLLKKYRGTAVSLNNFLWFDKIGHFLLNPIGHMCVCLSVCSLNKLKVPIFKTNWPILFLTCFVHIIEGELIRLWRYYFEGSTTKTTRTSQLTLFCEHEGLRVLILKIHMNFPNFRAEEYLFYSEDRGTTLFSKCKQIYSRQRSLISQQTAIFNKGHFTLKANSFSTHATRKYLNIFFHAKNIWKKTVEKIKTYCMSSINFPYVLSLFK
jgi:hypothetical protein